MTIEVAIGIASLVLGAIVALCARRKRKPRQRPEFQSIEETAIAAAAAGREAVTDNASVKRTEVEDVASDPTPVTDQGGLADIANARRRARDSDQ